MTRTFEDKPATREKVPLLIGLMGPSGGGKTYSALKLATGIQRVTGGDIHMIDTEARRSLHYADVFSFRHVSFSAPFSPLDYLAAVEHCVSKGAGIVIVDSMSHEHEGPGGVLEMHEAEVARLSHGDPKKVEAVKMLAWGRPKAERRRLINTLLQYPCNFIFCFRAKNKIKLASKAERRAGEEAVKQMGFMPIAGEEFVFEMTVNCLLLPNAGGIPTWQSEEQGEQMMIKLPQQFRSMFLERSAPLNEDMGEKMARWAAGELSPFARFTQEILDASSKEDLEKVAAKLSKVPKTREVSPSELETLRATFKNRKQELEGGVPEGREPGVEG